MFVHDINIDRENIAHFLRRNQYKQFIHKKLGLYSIKLNPTFGCICQLNLESRDIKFETQTENFEPSQIIWMQS
jgi:hypothetical protein